MLIHKQVEEADITKNEITLKRGDLDSMVSVSLPSLSSTNDKLSISTRSFLR